MNRRGLLIGLGSLIASPVVVRAEGIMRVTGVKMVPVEHIIYPNFLYDRPGGERKADVANNMITDVGRRMLRWTVDPNTDRLFTKLEIAQVGTEKYAQWLRESNLPYSEFPPHISFGGCIVADPKGDPTFHQRWVEKTREELRTGVLPAA